MNKAKLRACSYCKGSGKELDPVAIGAELRKLREESGLIQELVGDRMGLSKQHICALEKGGRNWNEDLIARYKKALQS